MAKFQLPEEGSQNTKEFKVIPTGTHVARCISFVDIGTHEFEYQGETKSPRKVRISFETPLETEVFNAEAGEQPFMVSTELTLSFHEKANLFKLLSGWLGLTEENKKDFDPEKDLLGKECMITVQHETSKKGNKFAKIMSVSPLMKGTKCPEQVNESTFFFMGYNGHSSEFDDNVFAKLPNFIQEKIMESPEYECAKAFPKAKEDDNYEEKKDKRDQEVQAEIDKDKEDLAKTVAEIF